jgi:hypothetical protein
MNEEFLQNNFGTFHSRHVAALTRHLIECRRVFDGDMDLFLVLTIIGERTFTTSEVRGGMSREAFLNGSVSETKATAINLQSIAEYSGIPRETVRRKIEILIEKDWVARDANKYLTATDKANANLRELTESLDRYIRVILASWESACTATT